MLNPEYVDEDGNNLKIGFTDDADDPALEIVLSKTDALSLGIDLIRNNKIVDLKNEYVMCSAVWFMAGGKYDNQPKNIKTGFVTCGIRHRNCHTMISEMSNDNSLDGVDIIQGFLTSKDVFIDRKQALELAKKCGQVNKELTSLTSEDLW